MQSSAASCGAASLYNALCALGKSPSLEECERVCKTTATDGTSVKKLLRGCTSMGLVVACEIRTGDSVYALLLLDHNLRNGGKAIITVDSDSHWVTVIGSSGDRYLIADSADNELILSLSAGELLQRWMVPDVRRGFYGAVVK